VVVVASAVARARTRVSFGHALESTRQRLREFSSSL